MKFFTCLAMATLAVMPCAPHAAEITAKDAKALEKGFTDLLPAPFRSIFTVAPADGHYDARFDITPVLNALPKPWHITEMTPVASTITPRSDGLLDISAQGSMWLIGDILAKSDPSHFQLTADAYKANAVLDSLKSFPLSGQIDFDNFAYSKRGYKAHTELAAANYSLVLSSTDADKGMTNARIAATTRKFRERMTWFKLHGADVEITSPAIDAVDTLANLDREGVQQLFRLFVGSSATSLGTFDPARASEAKDIVEKHWPLATAYSERVDVTAPQVRIGKVSMSAASINMDLQLAHAEDGDNSALNFTVDKPVLAPGLYPHAFELAMPDSVALGMRFTGLRIQDFLTASLSARDQTGDGTTDNWLSRLYLSGDTTRFEFVNTAVKSQYYEAEVSGWLSGDFKSPTPGRPECDLTITARNLDKTVAFLQANANSVPQFGQASFVLLMAKGMAKQRADGSLVWHIQIDKVGRRFINGRKIGR